MATLAHLHESGLLAEIIPQLPQGEDVEVGPGDDAAVVRLRSPRLVITTDALVEGADFLLHATRPEWIGEKAATANLADVAAMGSRPVAVVVALSAPPETDVEVLAGISRGLERRCSRVGASIVGGDVGRASELSLAVTAVGALSEGVEPVLRSGARTGDVLAIGSPRLGRSAAGLAQLLAGDLEGEHVPWHDAPDPDLRLGWTVGRAATAMMDLSDGLVLDGTRMARASGIVLDLDRSALEADAAQLEVAARQLGTDPWEWVLHGGEEHAMLATFAEGAVPEGFRPIGRCRTSEGDARILLDGQDIAGASWGHFG